MRKRRRRSDLRDIKGQRFGDLVAVLAVDVEGDSRRTYWLCQCKCGGTKVCRVDSLKIGRNTTCGKCRGGKFEELKRLKPREAAYIAGLIDGEGCLNMSWVKQKGYFNCYALGVSVTQSEPAVVLDWLAEVTGLSQIQTKKAATERDKAKRVWYINRAEHVGPFLRAILPDLRLKVRQACLGLSYLRWRKSMGRYLGADGHLIAQAFYQQFRNLNERGSAAKNQIDWPENLPVAVDAEGNLQ